MITSLGRIPLRMCPSRHQMLPSSIGSWKQYIVAEMRLEIHEYPSTAHIITARHILQLCTLVDATCSQKPSHALEYLPYASCVPTYTSTPHCIQYLHRHSVRPIFSFLLLICSLQVPVIYTSRLLGPVTSTSRSFQPHKF